MGFKGRLLTFITGLLLCVLPLAYVSAADGKDFSEARVNNVRALSFSSDAISFGWDKVAEAEKYEIWQFNPQTNSYDLLDETDKAEYAMEQLEHGKKFTFLVRAYRYGESGEKEYCNFSDAFSMGTRPDDVTGLSARTTESEVSLSWDKVSEDAEYIIYKVVEGMQVPVTAGISKTNSYTDLSVQSACGYTYSVVAYVNDVNTASTGQATVITATCPTTPSITGCRGGDGRVKFTWTTKETAGTGYILYSQDIYGAFQEIARINDISTKEYIQLNLASYMSYNFRLVQYKTYNGTEYMSQPSNEVSATTTGITRTSVKPAIYKSNKKLKKSGLCKKYGDFSKYVTFEKNVIVPGIKCTNVYGFASESMILQAVCFAGDYMLISAYDGAEKECSVVYVISKSTGQYLTTLVLPDSYHVGGIAFDGNNVWISTGAAVSCFTYGAVVQAAASGEDSAFVYYSSRYPMPVQASFISYYDDVLWVGVHKETASAKMYGYKIYDKYAPKPTLMRAYSMGIPSRTQDVEFINKKNIIISRSNQIHPSRSRYYISRMERYKLDWSLKDTGKVKRVKCTGGLTMPPMMEGLAISGKYLYVSFESAQVSSCPYKMDRVCAVKMSKIKWNAEAKKKKGAKK